MRSDIANEIARIDAKQRELQALAGDLARSGYPDICEPWRVFAAAGASAAVLFGAAAAFVKLI